MKKLLLLVGAVMMSFSSFAQEDATYLISNAGFDEDLTFQADGTMKEAISTDQSLSERSWAYIAADSTVYARPKATSGQNRPDGRKMDAVNGFIGRVQGWTIETNQTFPKCEWVYFGTVPYDLASDAVPIADDGSTYLGVPSRPAAYSGDDNVGFAYLRAGWGGRAVYKQVVKLPCAVYRLEYWAININPNATNGNNLSKVTCRKDTWKDETGFTDQEWTLHTIEFTPTTEFTMEFGFESSGGSGSNPFLCIDGIRLYKIDEADAADLYRSDINDLMDECDELGAQAIVAGFNGLAMEIGDYQFILEEYLDGTAEELAVSLALANERIATFRKAIAEMENVDAMLAKMDELLQSTDFPGKPAFEEAYQKILGYKQNDASEDVDVAAQILGAVAEATAAIQAYYLTQTGSEENPTDFTIFIQHPWFIETAAEPVYQSGEWIFPKQYDEDGNDRYTEGSASSADLTSEGWAITGASGGDQRLNWQRGRSCWNAWNNNFTSTLAVGQTIEGLPNGYYTVAADLITQSGCLNNQRVYGESIADKQVSQSLSSEGWDYSEWETLSMTAQEKVLVVDGKLTIGAEGTGTGSGASGWFCATNFHLYYLGEAPAEAVKAAYDNRIAQATEYMNAMHFAVDKQALAEVIAACSANSDYVAAMQTLADAMVEAKASEAKYEDYIPSDGTVDGKVIPTVQYTLKKNGGEGYGAAEDIVQFAYDYVMTWVACDTATYTKFDATVALLENYLNTYTPAYNNAAEVAAVASAAGKAALQEIMDAQKAALTAQMRDLETVKAYVADLNRVVAVVKKQNVFDDPNATDYTAFIENPNLEAETGWEFNKGNGNNNTTSGQWFDASSTRYMDSYNDNGLEGYIGKQTIKDLPNGTYVVGAYTRTPANGAYIFEIADNVNNFVMIPMNYYLDEDADTMAVASDKRGPIWEEAREKVDNGLSPSDPDYDYWLNIYNANSGNGRGWQHQEMPAIEVKNHELTIGTCTGGIDFAPMTMKFEGKWYSVGGWTLTLVTMGDNSGWEGPLASGITAVSTKAALADGIYSLTGVRTNKLQRGLNIVVSGGQVHKVLVK